MSQAYMLSLPPELVSYTFNFIPKVDFYTLQSCSLVSRTWCYQAQRVLFQQITIANSQDSGKKWIERLRISPHLAKFIMHVTLSSNSSTRHRAWDTDLGAELARTLTHIRGVSIKSLHHEWQDGHNVFLGQLAGLHTFQIRDVTFPNPLNLFDCLSKLSGKLSSLSLQRVGAQPWTASYGAICTDSGVVLSNGVNPSNRLRHLVLSSAELRIDVLSWLLGAFDLSLLHSLVLAAAFFHADYRDNANPTTVALLEELLKVMGPSLKSLTLGVHRERPGDNLHIPILTSSPMLKYLESLEKLVLVSECAGVLRPVVGLPLANKVLSLLSRTSLRELVIVLDLSVPDTSNIAHLHLLPDWTTLDEQLSLPPSNSLQRLFIVVDFNTMLVRSNRSYKDSIENVIRKALPKLFERGILDIHVEVCMGSLI
ncbi:hypothetical protein E1B28_000749 [Marasmius oreades]|uniref:F-box domain-containing protein n=1 Tax=Marasmius oreades TaxID=181124 RepID=A0A9P8AEG4_9AGAR|nr:uncharacterized protein E1B28_000749 [Marasmius oreades]KAG7098846.1 hypothetical protein E1B28_000749 [Marasmius oreades]